MARASSAFPIAARILASAVDPLGASTSYAYDSADHLTQVFYPSNPATPSMTNLYDGLARV